MDEMRKSVIDRAEDIINGQNQAMSLVAEQRNAYTKIFALYQMAGGLTEHFWQSLDTTDPCKATGTGYVPHWATCPYADLHRKTSEVK